ncbi:hypothetical protein [Streptomyces sp. 900105755]
MRCGVASVPGTTVTMKQPCFDNYTKKQYGLNGLSLNGITVEYGAWTTPDTADGFSEVQANMRLTGASAWQYQGSCDRFSTTDPGTCPYGNWTTTPGNVNFRYTDGLKLTGNTATHLGAAGLQLGQGVANSSITGNVFTDIPSHGVEIGNGTDANPADVTVAHRTDSAGGTTGVRLDTPVSARCVRVIADRPNSGGQTGGQMAVSELAVYGGR